jgi:putative Mg2+ transporter-C (MgtC) family protein
MSWNQLITDINAPEISTISAVFKLLIAFIAGGIIGLNREKHNQAAGFRTHILICLGATLLMILSIYIPQEYLGLKNGDPGRIAAQVVSGIGFLGAGAIIRLGNSIKGITTAASIWLISGVGLTIGAGLYLIAIITVVLALFTLIVLEKIESRLIPNSLLKKIQMVFRDNSLPETEIKKILKDSKISIENYFIDLENNNEGHCNYSIMVQIPEKVSIIHIINELNKLPNLKSIKIN